MRLWTKNNEICYKSISLKTKNTITMRKNPKYSIFIRPSHHLSKGYYNFYIEKLENLSNTKYEN